MILALEAVCAASLVGDGDGAGAATADGGRARGPSNAMIAVSVIRLARARLSDQVKEDSPKLLPRAGRGMGRGRCAHPWGQVGHDRPVLQEEDERVPPFWDCWGESGASPLWIA
ncbi:hypothetical protein GCM10009734_94010 [Nonomuraea bangladeshensis]